MGEGSRGRERGVQAGETALHAEQRARQLGDERFEARGLHRERGEERVEVGDQFAQVLLVDVQRRGDLADGGDQLGEVVRFGARDRLGVDRAAAQRRGAAGVDVVERLRGVQPAHFRFLFGVLGVFGLARQRFAVVDQEALQVGARVGVESVEHLVELDRIGGLGDRDRVAGGESSARRGCPAAVRRTSCLPGTVADGS